MVQRRGKGSAPTLFTLAKPTRTRRKQGRAAASDAPRLRQTKLDFSAAVANAASPQKQSVHNKAAPACRLAEIQHMLTSLPPASLPGREEEQEEVAQFVREAVRAGLLEHCICCM